MRIVIALVVSCGFVGLAAAQEPQQPASYARTPPFTPRFVPNVAPVPPWYQAPPAKTARQAHASAKARHDFVPPPQETEIICGLRVIRKAPDVDRGILAHPKHRGQSAIGRIKPPVCNPHR